MKYEHVQGVGWAVNKLNAVVAFSGDSRNFVQGIPISLWKNFGSFQSISSVSRRFGKYRPKFKIWLALSLCLKKKKFLKPKQICILYTEKPQNEKRNEKKIYEQR